MRGLIKWQLSGIGLRYCETPDYGCLILLLSYGIKSIKSIKSIKYYDF